MRRLVMYDWKNGVLRAWPRYLLSGILMVLLCMAQMRQAREGVKTGLYSGPSFGNYLAVWLKGMREPQGIAKIRHLKLPAEWLALQLGHAFVLAGYARADLDRNGRSLVLRAAGRTAWWDAKCIWAAMGTAVYYLMFYGIVAAASYLSGVTGAGGSMSVIPASRIWVSDFACPGHLVAVLSVFVFLPLTGLCAGLFQVLAEIAGSPLTALAGICGYQFAVLYWSRPFLLGNYAMLCRLEGLAGSETQLVSGGICLCLILAGGAYAAGRLVAKRMEF